MTRSQHIEHRRFRRCCSQLRCRWGHRGAQLEQAVFCHRRGRPSHPSRHPQADKASVLAGIFGTAGIVEDNACAVELVVRMSCAMRIVFLLLSVCDTMMENAILVLEGVVMTCAPVVTPADNAKVSGWRACEQRWQHPIGPNTTPILVSSRHRSRWLGEPHRSACRQSFWPGPGGSGVFQTWTTSHPR